jgi:hypothetical protein
MEDLIYLLLIVKILDYSNWGYYTFFKKLIISTNICQLLVVGVVGEMQKYP